jgi:N-methylhydantoinase B
VLGGEPGMRSTKKLVRTDGSEEWLPAKVEGIKVRAGDLLYFNTWGGGGWGDPYARDPRARAQDVARRLVSVEGARRYGVVIADDGSASMTRPPLPCATSCAMRAARVNSRSSTAVARSRTSRRAV